MDKLILVLYVDIGDLEEKHINQHVKYVGSALFTEEVILKTGAITFVIPTRTGGTRIECINPKYVADVDLYNSFLDKIGDLNDNINYLIHMKKKDN
jgi:hypothetical protein